ncbi:MAG: DUF6614 family protein [Akkermansiaceae bacterium]
MVSYHVYFSPKEGITPTALIKQVHEFMTTQIKGNFAKSYRILRMDNKASFQSLPDYHLIVDYASEEDLQKGFNAMKPHYKDKPHSPLMSMVSDFKVAFSSDEEPISK